MQTVQSIESIDLSWRIDVGKIGSHSKGVLDIEDVQLGDLGVKLQQQRQGLANAAGRSENGNANIVLLLGITTKCDNGLIKCISQIDLRRS